MYTAIPEATSLTPASLTDQVRELHEARQSYADAKEEVRKAQERFNLEHADILKAEADARDAVNVLESCIRINALNVYDGANKAVCPGVNVRVLSEYRYDPTEAFKWAKEHGLCLTLDGKAFKDICQSDSTRPDFVAVDERPTATIASDLGKALGG